MGDSFCWVRESLRGVVLLGAVADGKELGDDCPEVVGVQQLARLDETNVVGADLDDAANEPEQLEADCGGAADGDDGLGGFGDVGGGPATRNVRHADDFGLDLTWIEGDGDEGGDAVAGVA